MKDPPPSPRKEWRLLKEQQSIKTTFCLSRSLSFPQNPRRGGVFSLLGAKIQNESFGVKIRQQNTNNTKQKDVISAHELHK
jgi:hypothetical protein